MNLRQNILDSIKECEIKLGYREEAINLYYPKSVLLELLAVPETAFTEAVDAFCASVKEEFGAISIAKTNEKGRYQINIPKKGVAFVHENVKESPFVREFVEKIHSPGMTKDAVVALFQKYSEDVVVEQEEEREWAVYFADPGVDAYVYYIEEDEFGLQYHRFTPQSYQALREH